MGVQGHYKVAIVDSQGNEIWRQPKWEKNLILNQGMDALATQYLCDVMKYGIAGTGTRVNFITSSASQGSVINGGLALDVQPNGIQDFTTTAYGGWTGCLTAGDTVQFADGTEVKVGSVALTSAGVTPTDTVSTQSFTIWKTSQTALETEVKRGGSGIAGSAYLTGVGNCGSSTVLNTATYLRTYDFAVEATPKVYAEVGVSWATSGAGTTFSRIVLPQTVSIDVSQRLRLVYQLSATFTPTASQYVSNAVVSGWPVAPATNTNMTESIQQMWVSSIDTNGTSNNTYAALEPPSVGGNYCAFWGSSNSQSLVTFGSTPINRALFGSAVAVASTADSYIAGTYLKYKNGTFDLADLNYQNLRSFGFGAHAPNSYFAYGVTGQAFTMLFEQSQSKYNTQTLTMTFKWNWSRVLA